MQCSKTTVFHAVNRYRLYNTTTNIKSKQTPSKTTAKTNARIVRLSKKNSRQGSNAIRQEINDIEGLNDYYESFLVLAVAWFVKSIQYTTAQKTRLFATTVCKWLSKRCLGGTRNLLTSSLADTWSYRDRLVLPRQLLLLK